MKRILNILLFLFAWVVFLPATIVNYFIVASKGSVKGYFRNSALRLDRYGCGEFRTLWNTILITKKGIKFKADGNTISAYIGANQMKGTLKGFGKFLAWVLDLIDKGHCKRAYNKRIAEIRLWE